MVTEQRLDIVTYNKNALNNLRRAVVLGQGQFSLILARANYQQLRRLLIEELSDALRLAAVAIPPTATRLRDAIVAAMSGRQAIAFPKNAPQALMVTGLENIESPAQLEQLLKAANLGRDELPKTFKTPLVLWVNDATLQQLNRYAPDLKSFAATPIRFEYPLPSLISGLTAQANDTFGQVLNDASLLGFGDISLIERHLGLNPHTSEPLASQELSFALAQIESLESQEHLVTNEQIADLLFLQGRNLHQQGDLEKARSYYETSLSYWQKHAIVPSSPSSLTSQDKQSILLFHLGLWWRAHAAVDRHNYVPACEQAQQYFEACLTIFREQNRSDRVGHFILALAEVLHKLDRWTALSAIAQEGAALHRSDPVRLARDYGYLAEVALARYSKDPHPDYLSEAEGYAQQALEISEQATVRPESFAEQVALRYHRGSYLYLLARAQQLQGQPERAIANLEKARLHTEARYDLSLYRHILDRLWHLYFNHQHYADAFEIKLAQRRVESLFGLRAFIGASQIPPAPAVASRSISGSSATWAAEQATTAEIAAEIKASGRQPDIEALTGRLSQARYPIVVIHGQSGVGKSSILSAGLIPRLRRLITEGRTTYPMLISSYSRWAAQLEMLIKGAAEPESEPESEPGGEPRSQLANKPKNEPSSGELIDQLKALTQAKYQQIVLVFDQFEDFFYEYPAIEQRRDLYTFLRDCLDAPYIKVVLTLREDFLHYLLEWDRSADLSTIENDILSKEIRYYLGNFMPNAAEMVIRQLTSSAGFYLEDGLITALVDDLAANNGEVRPIELQVVGAQLQRENVRTLEAYRQLGRSPKSQLLKNFLDNVIHDCGPENKAVAQSVLYLLSEGAGRPLKSHSEIEEALTFANIANEPQQLQLVLDILIGSGLVFEAPEVSGVRYQLVHEYLASLVQQQPPAGVAETGLLEALQTERCRRQQSESQLEEALAARSDSLLQTSLAYERTQAAEIRSLVSVARSLRLSGNGLGALVKAMRAARQLSQSNSSSDLLKMQTALCLDATLREIREKNELSGHNNWVLAVDYGPTHIASASDDGTIKLWSPKGELIRTLTGHQAGVVDVRFSSDGQYLASASLDHTIRLWQANGDFIRSLETASASVTSVSFSPTEPILAATYSDALVRLWNLSGELVRTLKGHEDWARTVAFSPDGQTLATGGEDQTVRLWRTSGELLHIFHGHQGWVRSVAFSPDGQTVLSAGDANTLRLWSRSGCKLKTLYGHEDWVRSVAFSPDGQRIASGSDDQTIKIWSIEGTIQQTFNQRSSVHSLAWSADGGSVVSGGDDDQVHVWHLEGPPEPICRAHTGIVWSACWQPAVESSVDLLGSADAERKSNRFISAGGNDTIKLWSVGGASPLKNRAELLRSIVGHRRGVHSLAWSPEGDFFASASADHSVRLWTADGEVVRSLTGHEASVWQVSYSPDGTRLASVSGDRTLRLWTPKGKLLKTYTGHTDTVWHVSFSPDGQHLITASEDNTLRLWHLKRGMIQSLEGHSGGVWCALFSPNGQLLASGGADGVIRLWSVSWQGQQQMRIEPKPLMLKGHRDWVRSLSFSPDGKFLASASDDGTVRLWSLLPEVLASLSSVPLGSAASVASNHLLPPLTGHEGVIWDVDFDAAGERLVTASADGTVRVWDLRLSALMKKGCDWLEDWLIARPDEKAQLCKEAKLEVSALIEETSGSWGNESADEIDAGLNEQRQVDWREP